MIRPAATLVVMVLLLETAAHAQTPTSTPTPAPFQIQGQGELGSGVCVKSICPATLSATLAGPPPFNPASLSMNLSVHVGPREGSLDKFTGCDEATGAGRLISNGTSFDVDFVGNICPTPGGMHLAGTIYGGSNSSGPNLITGTTSAAGIFSGPGPTPPPNSHIPFPNTEIVISVVGAFGPVAVPSP